MTWKLLQSMSRVNIYVTRWALAFLEKRLNTITFSVIDNYTIDDADAVRETRDAIKCTRGILKKLVNISFIHSSFTSLLYIPLIHYNQF